MSNCIEFIDNTHVVLLGGEEIDIPALQALITKAEALPTYHGHLMERDEEYKRVTGKEYPVDEEEFNKLSAIWWFLSKNVDFSPDGTEIAISFGVGRSSLSYRDLRYLVNEILRPLMRQKVSLTFHLVDTGNPGKWFKCPVTLGEQNKDL